MKKVTAAVFAALTGILAAAATAHAALMGFAPTPATLQNPDGALVTIGGLPAWYQDVNGVSVQPCLNVAKCGLMGLGDPLFNENLPLSYPDNFPSEAFYFDATAIFPVGNASALVVLALEFTFVDPITGALTGATTPGALSAPFQRQRLVLTYPPGVPVPTAGNFTISHPWGQTTFPFASVKCSAYAGGQKCSMTQDLPLVGMPVNFAAALGTGVPGSMSTFLKDPLAPAGFLGTGAATSFTGAGPGSNNSISVTDPLGNTGSSASLTLLVGRLAGLPATPGAIAFPPQKPGVTSGVAFVTVTNPSFLNPATLAAPTIAGANSSDFTLIAGATVDCLPGVVLPPGGACTFGVTFSDAAVNGAKSAAITFDVPAPAKMPPTVVRLSGEIDNLAPTIISTIPADAEINVPSNNAIIATFSETVMNIVPTTYTLVGPGGAVSGTVAFDAVSKTASFTPLTNLATNATYTATITTGVSDLAGNTLAKNFVWSFKTAAPNAMPPLVISTNPPANVVGVPINVVISATFNVQVNPISVNNTTFFLNGGPTGSVTYDPIRRTAMLKPHTMLLQNQLYTAMVTTGIVSLGSVTMASSYVWSFFTATSPVPFITVTDSVPPVDDRLVPFGSVIQGGASEKTVTITNNGNADLMIGTIVSENSGNSSFSIAADSCSGKAIAPAGSCTLTIRFAPAAVGTFTGAFDISSNASNSLIVVNVSGTGTPIPVPDIAVTDSAFPESDLTIPFGNVTQGVISPVQTISIANAGTAALTIANIKLAGTDASQFSLDIGGGAVPCGTASLTVAAGENCTATVTFNPISDGPKNATVIVNSDDPDEATVSVALTGTGLPVSTNNAPSAPELAYPANGQEGLGTSITCRWKKSQDPDGDTVTYRVYYCTDRNFTNCTPDTAANHRTSGAVYAYAGLPGLLLFGAIFAVPRSGRKKIVFLLMAAVIIGGVVVSCGGGGGNGAPAAPDEASHLMSGLIPSTTYYWKVVADDGNGGTKESAVWSFTTR